MPKYRYDNRLFADRGVTFDHWSKGKNKTRKSWLADITIDGIRRKKRSNKKWVVDSWMVEMRKVFNYCLAERRSEMGLDRFLESMSDFEERRFERE